MPWSIVIDSGWPAPVGDATTRAATNVATRARESRIAHSLTARPTEASRPAMSTARSSGLTSQTTTAPKEARHEHDHKRHRPDQPRDDRDPRPGRRDRVLRVAGLR